MEEVKEDMKKKYPSLPPNYVSLAQLQERWIQQQQQKQENEKKEQEQQQEDQEEQVASENRKAQRSGRRRNHLGVNGERRIDAHFPQPQKMAEGSNGRWDAMRKTGNKYNKRRWPRERPKGKDPVRTLAEDGAKSAVLIGKSDVREANPGSVERNGYEKEEIQEIASDICMVELLPEIKGKEVNPMGFSRISRGKQLVSDQFSSRNASRRFEGKSRGDLVVNGQFSSSTNDDRVEVKSRGKETVNGQFWGNSDDRGVEGSVNEYMMEVLPENVSKEDVSVLKGKNGRRYNNEFKRSAEDEGLNEEGNGYMVEVLRDTEADGKGSGDEKRKTGKVWRMKRNYNDNRAQLKLDQQQEGGFAGQKERNGPKTRTGRRVREYGNKDRVSGNQRPEIIRDFRDLSLYGSRNGYSNRGQVGSYGRRFASARKGKQVDGGLTWVKKEEISGSNADADPARLNTYTVEGQDSYLG